MIRLLIFILVFELLASEEANGKKRKVFLSSFVYCTFDLSLIIMFITLLRYMRFSKNM